MSVAELKLKLELINKITEIEEIRIIEGLKRFLDFELNEDVFELSQKQQKRISEARIEYANGETFTNKEVEDEIEKWLNVK